MGWELRVFFPLPSVTTTSSTTTTPTSSATSSPTPFNYFTHSSHREAKDEEKRTDDYVVIANDALGLKMRGVSGKKSKKLELKYRQTINEHGQEQWSKEDTTFDAATPSSLPDALRRAVAAMAKKEARAGRWSLAHGALSAVSGRSLSGGIIVLSVTKQRKDGRLTRGGVFEQTDLTITSNEWSTPTTAAKPSPSPTTPSAAATPSPSPAAIPAAGTVSMMGSTQRWRSIAFEGGVVIDEVAPCVALLRARYGDQLYIGGYPQFLSILHNRMMGVPVSSSSTTSGTEHKAGAAVATVTSSSSSATSSAAKI